MSTGQPDLIDPIIYPMVIYIFAIIIIAVLIQISVYTAKQKQSSKFNLFSSVTQTSSRFLTKTGLGWQPV